MNDRSSSKSDEERRDTDKIPPAGPHARPKLVDREKTPGTGALPEPSPRDVDPGVG